MPMVTEVLPLALGVVVSPIAIAVVIALLMTRHARITAAGFVVGWAVGLFGMVVTYAWLADALGFDGTSSRPVLAVVELSAAGLLALLAVVQFFGGRGLASRSLRGLDGFRMPHAAALGVAGSVLGPKAILLTGIAGATIATGGRAHVWTAGAAFAVVGSIGVALPVVFSLVAPSRVSDGLVRARTWITVHDRAASAVSLIIVALVLVLDAVANRAV